MSILSNPQGTPERVWSLVSGLGALGGKLPRSEFSSILNPGYFAGGLAIAAQPANAANGTGAATALELVKRNGNEIELNRDAGELNTTSQFSDYVHDFVCSRDAGNIESVIAEAYAWLVVESHARRDLGWLYELGANEFADQVDAGLVGEDDDGRLMNPTKVTAWRRWLLFMGLSVKLPSAIVDYPMPAKRIEIELRRANVGQSTSMPAGSFVDLLASRCPYLDRGRLFQQACARKGYTADRRTLSAVLSNALRELNAEGKILLKLSRDTADAISLCPDPTTRSVSFDEVEIWPEVKQ